MKFNKNKKLITFTAILAVVAIGGATLAKIAMAEPKTQEKIVPPSTFEVKAGEISQRVTASGTTMATEETSIFIELSQTVETVYTEVGDVVEKGQLLVTYDIEDDKKDLETSLEKAKITLQNAQIALKEIADPATGTELIELKNQVITAQKNLDDAKNEITTLKNKVTEAERDLKNAKKTMEDNEELLKVDGVSQSDYNTSVDNYEKANTTLEEAKESQFSKEQSLDSYELALEKANLNLENGQNKLNDPATANSYEKQQNTVRTAQMEIETVQNKLAKLTEATYSPISGTIIESNAVEGQMLTDSTVMMKVADLSQMDLEAYVSEYDIAKIAIGQNVELTSDGIEDKIYHGTVTKIEPTAESRSTISGSETVVPIKVHMTDNDNLVKPGFSFDLEIIVVDLEDVNYVPVSAVVKEKDGSTYVYEVEENQILKKTKVTLGTYSDVYVQLVDGLSQNAVIMTSPDDTVKDGANLMDYAKVSSSSEKSSEKSDSILDSMGSGMTGGNSGGGPSGGAPGGGGMPGGGR